MADRDVDVLIVGGGLAASTASQELRSQGFDGSVLVVGRELDPPYERPPLSKSYLAGRSSRDDALLPVPDDVELLRRTSVMKLDPQAREARLSTKETVGFRHAILATGANVRRLQIEGGDLERIHYLRTLPNSGSLREDAQAGGRVGIIGGSFIGCEVAASLSQLGIASTLVFPEEAPMALQFGSRVGARIRALLSEHGVEVLAGEQVARLRGDGAGEGAGVAAIECASGRTVQCSAVLVAIGVVPDVMLARQAGLELGERGGVLCSATLESSAEGIFAAGDICEYDSAIHGRVVRIEHYEVAAAQGRHAARGVLGASEPYTVVPYFWSDLADWTTLESVGPAVDGWDDEEVRGSLDDLDFSVFYRRGGRLVAAMTAGRSADLDEASAELSR